jgi:hypothetical protein
MLISFVGFEAQPSELAQPVKQRILEMVDTALYHLMSQENVDEATTQEAVSADAQKLGADKGLADSQTHPTPSRRGTALYKLVRILGTLLLCICTSNHLSFLLRPQKCWL